MAELKLYRGTTSKYIRGNMVFAHPQRMEIRLTVTPRIYFTLDPEEAAAYAIIKAGRDGGQPVVVEIDMTKVRGRLRRDPESEFIPKKTGSWYIKIGSWSEGLSIIKGTEAVSKEKIERYGSMLASDIASDRY